MDNNSKSLPLLLTTTFLAGMATCFLIMKTKETNNNNNDIDSNNNNKMNAGAIIEGNDCSLFYGTNDDEMKQLTIVKERSKFLPSELYSQLVNDCIVCCVDALIVRTNKQKKQNNKKECLLVLRSTEPVKGVWWLPGGRICKGETFFQAAIRKASNETGLSSSKLKPIQILGVWNTFFPTSHWDNDTCKGTQTVNPIVLVEIIDDNDNNDTIELKLDETSEQYKWIELNPQKAIDNNIDKYIVQALLRLQAWNPNYIS